MISIEQVVRSISRARLVEYVPVAHEAVEEKKFGIRLLTVRDQNLRHTWRLY